MTSHTDLVARLRVKRYAAETKIGVTTSLLFEAADLIESQAKEIGRLKGEHPEGMEGRKILFEECSKGHGHLRGENWIENPCQVCRVEATTAEVARLKKVIFEMHQELGRG